MNSHYYSNDFGWRYNDVNNVVAKKHGHEQHGKNLTNSQKLKVKKQKLQIKKSRRINRGKKFNHN